MTEQEFNQGVINAMARVVGDREVVQHKRGRKLVKYLNGLASQLGAGDCKTMLAMFQHRFGAAGTQQRSDGKRSVAQIIAMNKSQRLTDTVVDRFVAGCHLMIHQCIGEQQEAIRKTAAKIMRDFHDDPQLDWSNTEKINRQLTVYWGRIENHCWLVDTERDWIEKPYVDDVEPSRRFPVMDIAISSLLMHESRLTMWQNSLDYAEQGALPDDVDGEYRDDLRGLGGEIAGMILADKDTEYVYPIRANGRLVRSFEAAA